MDAKLRDFLRRRGVSDSDLDKISRGQVPDDDLHKGTDSPVLEKFRECDRLVKEIREHLERIASCDRERAAFKRSCDLTNLNKLDVRTLQ